MLRQNSYKPAFFRYFLPNVETKCRIVAKLKCRFLKIFNLFWLANENFSTFAGEKRRGNPLYCFGYFCQFLQLTMIQRARKARIYKSCNTYLQRKMDECDLTIKNVAVALGTHEGCVINKFKDVRTLNVQELVLLGGLFGVPTEVLLAAMLRNLPPSLVVRGGLAEIVAAKVREELGG
jgi:hypothetical protein